MGWFSRIFKSSGKERPSPQDWLPTDSVSRLASLIATLPLNIPLANPPKIWTPYVPDTNSMDPVSDFGHNNIFVAGADEADHKKLIDFLKVGDVAAYRFPADPNKTTTTFINHRIIQIGKDKLGRFFYFKGDNNNRRDPFTVRDENIKWISLGVIY